MQGPEPDTAAPQIGDDRDQVLQERSLLDKGEVLAYLIVHGKAHHYDALIRVGKEIDKVQAS